jgi:hypothetical protein
MIEHYMIDYDSIFCYFWLRNDHQTYKNTGKSTRILKYLKMSQEFQPHSLSIPSLGCTFSIHGVFQGKL